MRFCCIAQGTISSHLRWNMEDNVRKRVCMTGSLCCTVEIDRTLSINCNGKNKNHYKKKKIAKEAEKEWPEK